MAPDQELTLVRKALCCSLTGCVEWRDDRTMQRIRNDSDNQGLTPRGIKQLLVAHVLAHPESVEQRREQRPDYPQGFWYRVIVPVEGFRHGLFVEIVLIDEDEDYPCVQLVNAHPQRP